MPDFLAHYGVLGMKWGRRKSRGSVSSRVHSRASTKKKQTRILESHARAMIKYAEDYRHGKISKPEMEKLLEFDRILKASLQQPILDKRNPSALDTAAKVAKNIGDVYGSVSKINEIYKKNRR